MPWAFDGVNLLIKCYNRFMPFTKITHGKSKGNYRSKESGKIYTPKQLRAYFATKGWKRKPREKK